MLLQYSLLHYSRLYILWGSDHSALLYRSLRLLLTTTVRFILTLGQHKREKEVCEKSHKPGVCLVHLKARYFLVVILPGLLLQSLLCRSGSQLPADTIPQTTAP